MLFFPSVQVKNRRLKSDHSGIEIFSISPISFFGNRLKSDHSGIEMSLYVAAGGSCSGMLKSDHSGIEMNQARSY